MKKTKKELLKVILIYSVGIAIVMLMCWNAKQYDKAHPVQKTSSYYEYELSHHN